MDDYHIRNIPIEEILDSLNVSGIISVFSCFTDENRNQNMDLNFENIPLEIQNEIFQINKIHNEFQDILDRRKLFFSRNETYDTSFVKYIYKWCTSNTQQECISVLREYLSENDNFIGQFVKKILKIVNISREIEKMCETSRNISLLSKIKEIEEKLLKSIVTTQSLYF